MTQRMAAVQSSLQPAGPVEAMTFEMTWVPSTMG